jgi:hypothetical protein
MQLSVVEDEHTPEAVRFTVHEDEFAPEPAQAPAHAPTRAPAHAPEADRMDSLLEV